MCLHRTHRPLWLLPILLAGCSSTVGSRFGGTSQSRSIAVVGEHPLPAATGEPGGRVVADEEGPEPKRNPRTRISGRVLDEAGDPVPGATVRLADGAVKGGKEIRGTTDRSGGFTLNGLRPGSTYVLVAEGEDERGPILGRVEARTAETGVEISLARDEKPTTRRSARPPRVKPISNREEAEGVPDREESARINREDVAAPAGEADSPDPGPPDPRPAGRPQLSPPETGVGWKNSKATTASRAGDDAVESGPASSDSPTRRQQQASAPAPGDEDDATDPLPPAHDRGTVTNPDDVDPVPPPAVRKKASRKVGAKPVPKPREAGEMAVVPEVGLDEKAGPTREIAEDAASPALAGGRRPPPPVSPGPVEKEVVASGLPVMPEVGGESIVVAAHDGPSPTASPPDLPAPSQELSPSKPAPQPALASQGATSAPAEKAEPVEDYNPFSTIPAAPAGLPIDRVVANRTTESQPQGEEGAVGRDEAPKKKWGELAAIDRPAVVVQPTKAILTGSIFRRMRAPAEPRDAAIALCTYDTKLRKINDFRLPDLEGKPVRFRDLDADFILLDFWGTWCAPCLDAIPHLVSLQKKYGPDKLKVVGIACEEVPPDQRKARVEEISRKLGINYPILLSTMDGKPCPVQQALQVQAMPTMILVDRRGQVLWRNAGSTPASEGRLDRVLALAISRGDSSRR